MRYLVAAAIFIASLFISVDYSYADEQPCQWNYQNVTGRATAIYCGDALVKGTLTVNGSLNIPASVTNVATVAALRAGTFTSLSISLQGWTTGGDGGGGILDYNALDTTSADNGCTIFVDAAGHRYYRYWPSGAPLLTEQCGIFPGTGTNPASWIDQTSTVKNALVVASGRMLKFNIGPYKFSGDLASGATSDINIEGATDAFIELCQPNYTASCNWLIDPNAGSSYNQTPPAWALTNYTVFYETGNGLFGSPDTVSTHGYTSYLRSLSNIIAWAGSSTTEFGIHSSCIQQKVSNSTFVLFSWFTFAQRGGGDYCKFERVASIDGGWNLAGSGTIALNAPTYCTGAAFLWASTGAAGFDYQQYCGVDYANSRIWYTQSGIEKAYVFVRNDTLVNKSGYRAMILAGASGDLKFTQFQATTGVIAYASNYTMDNSHIESYASLGTTTATNADLYAIYNYTSRMTTISGWLGLGVQLHNGPNASLTSNWVANLGLPVYNTSTVGPPGSVELTPNSVRTFGAPFSNSLSAPLCVNTTAGTGGTQTFTFPSVFPDGHGLNALVGITLTLSTNLGVNSFQWWQVAGAKSSAWIGTAQAIAPVLNTVGTLAATFAASISGDDSTTSQGQNLQVIVTYTGSAWTVGAPVCLSAGAFNQWAIGN